MLNLDRVQHLRAVGDGARWRIADQLAISAGQRQARELVDHQARPTIAHERAIAKPSQEHRDVALDDEEACIGTRVARERERERERERVNDWVKCVRGTAVVPAKSSEKMTVNGAKAPAAATSSVALKTNPSELATKAVDTTIVEKMRNLMIVA